MTVRCVLPAGLVFAATLAALGGCSTSETIPETPPRAAVRRAVRPLVSAPPPAPSLRSGPMPTAEDRRMMDEANRMRAEHGLRAFAWNDRLFEAAREHSVEQARHGYMGHGSPDPARDELADRLRLADCGPLRAWAEVVAMGYDGPATVVDGWMNSRGHRKILLDPNLEEAAFSRIGDYFTGDFLTKR